MAGRAIHAGLLAAAAAAMLLAPAPTAAWCQMTTRQATAGSVCETEGIPLSWDRRCMEYAIDGRGSKDMSLERVSEIVGTSFGAWLEVTCDGERVDFEVREHAGYAKCGHAEYNTDDGNVNTVAFVTDWAEREYDPLAYALTTVWHNTRSGQIYDADMEINENRGTYMDCPLPDGCNDPAGRLIDLQNVVTHEAGHFFGLGHTQPIHSTASMYAISPPGEVGKRFLRADDIEGFCTIYPPGSLPDACDFTPRHGLALDCEDDGCGCSAPGAGRGQLAWLALLPLAAALLRRRRQ